MSALSKQYKQKLAKAAAIRCDRCQYHRGENASRRERPDRYKSHRQMARLADQWMADLASV